MINGLGVVGWGVGGIEAEVGMLGQPVYFQAPRVTGVHLTGELGDSVTATDLALALTALLRQAKVVGEFVEFFGEGAAALNVADRATIANMAPEYGATMGFFPADFKTLDYLRMTGRSLEKIGLIEAYLKAQGLLGMPKAGDIDYSRVIEFDLSQVVPSVAGPKRPQDRVALTDIKGTFESLLVAPIEKGGYDLSGEERGSSVTLADGGVLRHGSVLIAAITSCTNTSNPSVMMAAGLLAKNAVEKGLTVPGYVKTSLEPGSRVVSAYLEAAGVQPYLDRLGFQVVGYGCTTCIGNSGPLEPAIEAALLNHQLVGASVLSGNRNFEARVHPSLKANFLMSPPLVVAFALAGRIDIDFEVEPIGHGADGSPVYLRDIWPSRLLVEKTIESHIKPDLFKKQYSRIYDANEAWERIAIAPGSRYAWRLDSTYIQKPPFFEGCSMEVKPLIPLKNMRALAVLGDSVTTDHISPAGFIQPQSPAGLYLSQLGIALKDFNSYGARRGNDRVMVRGTFANSRIKNVLAQGREGGYTCHFPSGDILSIYEASQRYQSTHTPLVIFAGKDYGMGSSRDWAAKGTALLGVKAVIAVSFERIHRSNLIGMGVLPFEFESGDDVLKYGITGNEIFSFEDLSLAPAAKTLLKVLSSDGHYSYIPLKLRLDTAIEIEYYRNGGLLPYMLRQILMKPVQHG
jgi:aconitate hydratase